MSFSVKLLFSTFSFFGVLPHKTLYSKNVSFRKLALQLKNIIVISVIVVGTFLALYYNFHYIYPHQSPLIAVISFIRFVTGLALPILYLPNLLVAKKSLLKFQLILDRLEETWKAHFKILIRYVALTICMFVYLAIIYFYIPPETSHNYFSILAKRHIILGYYYEFVTAVTFVTLRLEIVDKLTLLDQLLKNQIKRQIKPLNCIKTAKRLYLSSYDTNRMINDYFGIKLLLILANGATRTLWFSTKILEAFHPTISKGKHMGYGGGILLILGMVPTFLIVRSCAATAKTVHNHIITTCYSLQDKFQYQSYEYRELQGLWKFILENRLGSNASGFFEITPTVLLGIIGSSITYFIALIQFI